MAAISVAARQLKLHQEKKRAKKLARRADKLKELENYRSNNLAKNK